MESLTNLEKESAKLREKMEAAPDDLFLKLRYGHVCSLLDRRLEALCVFQEVLAVEENADARLAVAEIFAFQGYYAESCGQLERLFETDPINLSGHILLHTLNAYTTLSDALKPHLDFVPSKQYLQEELEGLNRDRGIVSAQISEYSALVFGIPDPEPIMQYRVLEARKHLERLNAVLEKCEEWGKSAGDEAPEATEERRLRKEAQRARFAKQYDTVQEDGDAVQLDEGALSDNPEGATEDVDDGQLSSYGVVTSDNDGSGAPDVVEGSVVRASEAGTDQFEEAENTGVGGELPQLSAEQIKSLLKPLQSTRGISGAIIYHHDLGCVGGIGKLQRDTETLADMDRAMRALSAVSPGLSCWVLEGKGGLLYVQRLAFEFILIVDSGSSNLNGLRRAVGTVVPAIDEALNA